jgi:hypothetical protein
MQKYEIQTFTEKRETSWAFIPHGGGEIDGPRSGPAPRPWDIIVEPTDFFRSEVKVLQVPHTSSVKTCHRCRGAGSLLCQECHGKGWVRTLSDNKTERNQKHLEAAQILLMRYCTLLLCSVTAMISHTKECDGYRLSSKCLSKEWQNASMWHALSSRHFLLF